MVGRKKRKRRKKKKKKKKNTKKRNEKKRNGISLSPIQVHQSIHPQQIPNKSQQVSQDGTSPALLFPDTASCRSSATSTGRIASIHLHQLPCEVQEDLVDVEPSPGRGLVERYAAPLAREVVCAVFRHLPVALEIRLVADYDDRHLFHFFDSQDGVTDRGELLEGREAGYRVDE